MVGTSYDPSDVVSVPVLGMSYSMVYQCAAAPMNSFCDQVGPWSQLGSCVVGISPTTSPIGIMLPMISGRCPSEYSSSEVYKAGDMITYSVADFPANEVVYECKESPLDQFCSQSAFAPGSQYSSTAWTMKGTCDGTNPPTPSPIPSTGLCKYSKCVSVSGGTETCTDEDVEPYLSSKQYMSDDVVRVGLDLFKCKEHPYGLWCGTPAYAPGPEAGVWSDAWSFLGVCLETTNPNVRNGPRATNPINDFVDLSLEWARLSERGPTISGHFMVMMNIAMFDAWAAFETGTTGIILDFGALRTDAEEHVQLYAMTDAAYEVLTHMGGTICDQAYLEAVNGENAADILDDLNGRALTLKDDVMEVLSLDSDEIIKAKRVSTAVVDAILSHIETDGSNFQNQYMDSTEYAVSPWCSPMPTVDDGISDYDFLDRSYTFNTFDAVAAKDYYGGTTPAMAVHPKVLDGTLSLTETWQSLSQIGIFPGEADGGPQYPMTPHWGGVTSISMPTGGNSFRSVYVGPYNAGGDLRQEWIDETTELVDLGELQQPGNCPRCRAESEYWELGDSFVYPPGWWMSRANDLTRSLDLDVRTTLQIILGTSITVFDAGIAAWDMKFAFDSIRPVTAVNELFFGTMVSDWTGEAPGNRVANIDERQFWRPYQLRRNASPPFPDVPSGHSVFSTSASVVLRNLLRTNVFDFTTEPFRSRFDTDKGFDGDLDNGNEDVTLDFKTISQAADAAGYSRLLGGIHMMQGNVLGLEMGAKIGHSSLQYLRRIFGEDDLGVDPVQDVNTDLVFGTGRDDALLVAPCGAGPVEVYAMYGDDILESTVGEECGPVNLFGGFGADTFRIGGSVARATIQDYKSGEDTIILLRESGPLTISIDNSVTTILIDGVPVVALDGVWADSDLDVYFGIFL